MSFQIRPKRFIQYILKQQICEDTLYYGIDIFLTLSAIYGGFCISEIALSEKQHKPSFPKMPSMFEQVLNSAIFTLKNQNPLYLCGIDDQLDSILGNVSDGGYFSHKGKATQLKQKSWEMLPSDGKTVFLSAVQLNRKRVVWEDVLFHLLCLLIERKAINQEDKNVIVNLFIISACSFWTKIEEMNGEESERYVRSLAQKLRIRINNRYNEKN